MRVAETREQLDRSLEAELVAAGRARKKIIERNPVAGARRDVAHDCVVQ
jgi:hypothetical protein